MARLLISADSHVFEPFDLWETRLPASLRDRAPHLEARDGVMRLVMEGVPPRREPRPLRSCESIPSSHWKFTSRERRSKIRRCWSGILRRCARRG